MPYRFLPACFAALLAAEPCLAERLEVKLESGAVVKMRLEAGAVGARHRQETIRQLFADAGCTVEEQAIDKHNGNVICTLPGQTTSTIILGGHFDFAEHGKHRNGLQRFRCADCGKTYTEEHAKPLGEMTVDMEKAVLALKLLLEGSSIRATERITELHRDTIMKLLVVAGEKCAKIMAKQVRNVTVNDVECDEIWGYVGKKEGHKKENEAEDDGLGDAYCFVAIERNTKLILNFTLGRRNQETTDTFIEGLRDAIEPRGRFQITTDGFIPYISAITTTLGHRVDFARLIKVYASPQGGEARYSPAEVSSMEVVPVIGNPDPKRVCTSIVERQNLTMRMQIRRLTRLTNAFSKKFENHWAAICLHFAYYNFCRVHRTLRVTPAMEAELTDRVWTIADLLK